MTSNEHSLKSLSNWLIVQQLAQADNKENIQAPRYCPFVVSISNQWIPLTQKAINAETTSKSRSREIACTVMTIVSLCKFD